MNRNCIKPSIKRSSLTYATLHQHNKHSINISASRMALTISYRKHVLNNSGLTDRYLQYKVLMGKTSTQLFIKYTHVSSTLIQ